MGLGAPNIMALYDRNCPACGNVVSQRQVPVWESGGWPCPSCGKLLRSTPTPLKLTWLITIPLSIGICFYFGLRDSTLILVALIAAIPISFVVHAVIGLLSSGPLELVPTENNTARKTDGNHAR